MKKIQVCCHSDPVTLILGQPDMTSSETHYYLQFKHLDLISSVQAIQGTGTEEKLNDTMRKQINTNPEEGTFQRKNGHTSPRP